MTVVLNTCDGGSRVGNTCHGESSPRRLVTTAALGGCLCRRLVVSSRRRDDECNWTLNRRVRSFVTVASDGGSRR